MRKLGNSLLWITLLLVAGCATDSGVSLPSSSENPSAGSTTTPETPSASVASPPSATSADANNSVDSLTDTQVIPGERVGAVTAATTHQDLVALFGAANLTDQQVNVGEGMTEAGTVVNPGSDRSFTVMWADETRTKPSVVRNLGPAWKTPQGIGVGTSFADLKQALGNFQLYGFGWDYGGTVVLEGSQLAQYDGLLILRVQPAASTGEESDAYQAVQGETLYPSSDRNFESLDLKVKEVIVYLSRSES